MLPHPDAHPADYPALLREALALLGRLRDLPEGPARDRDEAVRALSRCLAGLGEEPWVAGRPGGR